MSNARVIKPQILQSLVKEKHLEILDNYESDMPLSSNNSFMNTEALDKNWHNQGLSFKHQITNDEKGIRSNTSFAFFLWQKSFPPFLYYPFNFIIFAP